MQFRVFDNEKKVWVQEASWINNTADGLVIDSGEEGINPPDPKRFRVNFDSGLVMNGSPVYAGDIWSRLNQPKSDDRALIIFENGSFQKTNKPWGGLFTMHIDRFDLQEMWLCIGNLYERPELLPGYSP